MPATSAHDALLPSSLKKKLTNKREDEVTRRRQVWQAAQEGFLNFCE